MIESLEASGSAEAGGALGGQEVIAKITYGHKTAQEMAAELRQRLPKNSIGFRTVDKDIHIDLDGAPHYDKVTQEDIETPHVQTRDLHVVPNGKPSASNKSMVIHRATRSERLHFKTAGHCFPAHHSI